LIDYQRKLVIVHPPKTGGQAVQNALLGHTAAVDRYGVFRHDSYRRILIKTPTEVKDWPAAILTRDPIQRLVSFYWYVKHHCTRWDNDTKRYVMTFDSVGDFLAYADFEMMAKWHKILKPWEPLLWPQAEYAVGFDQ